MVVIFFSKLIPDEFQFVDETCMHNTMGLFLHTYIKNTVSKRYEKKDGKITDLDGDFVFSLLFGPENNNKIKVR